LPTKNIYKIYKYNIYVLYLGRICLKINQLIEFCRIRKIKNNIDIRYSNCKSLRLFREKIKYIIIA